MDAPVPHSYQRHLGNSSTTMRPSPPGSSGGSPRGMIPPPNPFAVVAPGPRAPGLTAPSLSQGGTRSPVGYNSASYSHSTSPSTASGGIPDVSTNDSMGISPTQISSASLNPQKRAYRQRRKDPSCDACRERKVKCDATETTACSECSSRNHKCQFTKETNRRMSSIKQVQDLQSQIAELTQLNTHLRTRMGDRDSMEIDRPPARAHAPESRVAQHPSPRRVLAPVVANFDHVRRNIGVHSRGIFEPPTQISSSGPVDPAEGLPDIPLRSDFAHISRSYQDSIHESYPILHWPTFHGEVDRIYTARSFQGMSREWIGLFFAVLACGCLNSPTPSGGSPRGPLTGSKFYEIASQAMTPWPTHTTVVHAQLLLLLSIYATESNMKSAGSMWLACAVRTAQSLALNSESQGQSVVEAEMRRRLWWAIFVRDRVASLAANSPTMISEDDCDDLLPSSVEDRYIQPQGFFRPRANSTHATGFVAVVQVTRLFAGLYQVLKSSVVTLHILQSYDEKFRSKLSLLPETYSPESEAYLEPAALAPILTLQFARFHLYRRNLSTVCQQAERAAALASCTVVAQDTAKYISRTLQAPSARAELEKSWQTRVAHLASNMLCMHLWRCILILCLRGDYQAALICLHLSAAIGDIRKVNTACGKNLIFFLDRLTERVRTGNGSLHQLEQDEEMLAYASGDLQSSSEHAWVWAGTERTSTAQSPQATQHRRAHSGGPDEPMQGTLPFRPNPSSPENGVREWDGWGRVEHMIRQLMEEQRPRIAPGPTPTYYPPPHNPVKRVQLAPDAPPVSPPKPSTGPSSASRISIANII